MIDKSGHILLNRYRVVYATIKTPVTFSGETDDELMQAIQAHVDTRSRDKYLCEFDVSTDQIDVYRRRTVNRRQRVMTLIFDCIERV